MIVLSGHQPNYLPYPGLIGKILHSDKFIYVVMCNWKKKAGKIEIELRVQMER